jgi:peroxiredoxin Q/BCP
MLKIGDACPDFSLPDSTGTRVAPTDLRGKPFVLFFYPKDDTPGCTAEACAFRDDYRSFVEAGAEMLGVSSDDGPSHARFARKHGLPFRLLSDTGGTVRRAFGVPATLGILPGRATFVIDASGTIAYAFNAQFLPKAHVANALDALRASV